MRPAEVAGRIGVDQSTLNRWEHGKIHVPDHQKFALAQLFGVTIVWLMGWDDDGDPEAA